MNKKPWYFWVHFMGLILVASTSAQAMNPLLDLTYPFDAKTMYWPTERGFNKEKVFYGSTPKGYFYAAYKFCAPEHGGTHIDAPRHFSATGYTVDELPLSQLIGHAVVIDVRGYVKNNPDYAITAKDIQQFEQTHRPLDKQDIVLFLTGWGQYWGNKKQYMGSDAFGDVSHLHFPGLSKAAARYIIQRKVKGIGIDTASMDPGASKEFWAHRIILGANLFGIENLAHLEELPILGAQLIVAPMKIKDGSGAPTRVYALQVSRENDALH